MNKLTTTNEKTMTVKEVASAMGVSTDTVILKIFLKLIC